MKLNIYLLKTIFAGKKKEKYYIHGQHNVDNLEYFFKTKKLLSFI
jgi:hypothetical protein